PPRRYPRHQRYRRGYQSGGFQTAHADPGFSQTQTSDQTKLKRGLKSRHIELIAIGGAIGVGLFLGSAKAIQNTGPGLILGYAVGGVVIFFIMRALGELLLYRPVAGSFVMYADEFGGPSAGFATGGAYWLTWVVTGMADLPAIGVYVGLLASRLSAMDNGIGRAGCAVRREYAGGARVRRDGVLVCTDQSRDDRHAHCERAGSHLFPRWRLRGDSRILESLVAWQFVTLRHTRRVAHIPDGDVRVSGSGADRCDRWRGRKS